MTFIDKAALWFAAACLILCAGQLVGAITFMIFDEWWNE